VTFGFTEGVLEVQRVVGGGDGLENRGEVLGEESNQVHRKTPEPEPRTPRTPSQTVQRARNFTRRGEKLKN